MTKQKKLRHSEYYDLQPVFDRLYAESQQGKIFTKLMDIISSEENIRLAYRNIKRNGGSNTAGTDKQTIRDIEKLPVVTAHLSATTTVSIRVMLRVRSLWMAWSRV